jgi:arginase
MQIRLIGLNSVEGVPPANQQPAGLAGATAAYLANGIVAGLEKAGASIESVVTPSLAAGDGPDNQDRIANLGTLNRLIAEAVHGALATGAAPVLMGGTCSHLIGMLAGLQQYLSCDSRIGLIWLDAHGDFNTPRTSRSGMLGGMPVAVASGLCWPAWREGAGMLAPLPTNRIVMVDVRNLDPEEAALIAATDVEIARFGAEFSTGSIIAAIDRLADRCDHLYLHIDADILDASLQPNHPTAELNGPGVAAVTEVINGAFATGKVRASGVVSVNPDGPEGVVSLASGEALLRSGVAAWVPGDGIAV